MGSLKASNRGWLLEIRESADFSVDDVSSFGHDWSVGVAFLDGYFHPLNRRIRAMK